MKRKFFLLILLSLLQPMIANAYDAEIDGIYYNFSGNEAAVTYQKELNISPYYVSDYSGIVAIPGSVTYDGTTYSVTSIGDYAFYNCSSLTSIAIPESVTNIGFQSFYKCTKLASITIPESVTNIKYGAFEYCRNLTAVTIPNSVTSIGGFAFYECTNLTSITIGSGVTNISYDTFCGCTSLTSITIPNSVTSIGAEAFRNCSNLTSISIPNSVTSIGNTAFHSCSSLTSVKIGSSVTRIGSDAFRYCRGLTSVTIPENVASIGARAFCYCPGLITVNLKSDAIVSPARTSSTSMESIFGNQVKTYIIGDLVKSIGDYVFSNCTDMTQIIIGSEVKSIGFSAFSECTNLTSVTLKSNAFVSVSRSSSTSMKTIFSNQIKTYIIGEEVKSIGNNAFYGCSGLTSLIIPDNVNSIGKSAFYGCSGLTSVIIGSGVKNIDNSAFFGCSGLTSVTIPGNVTSIGNSSFSNCISLTSVMSYIEKPFALDSYVFDNNTYNTATLYVPESAIGVYKSTNGWKKFKKIEVMPNGGDEQDRTNLVLWAKNGAAVAFALSNKPKITFTETDLQITGEDIDVTYPLDNMARFTYETDDYVTAIKDIKTEEVSFRLTGESLVFPALKANSTVSIYSLNGMLVFKKTVSQEGEYAFPLSNLSSGVYMVNVNGLTYKIVKR